MTFVQHRIWLLLREHLIQGAIGIIVTNVKQQEDEMRKLLSIAITSFMIFAFSNTAWCSVEGDWDITGKISVKVKIEGQRSEKSKGYI